MTVLPDHKIRELCCTHDLVVPFDESLLQPSSYDVRLGDRFMTIDKDRLWSPPRPVDLADPATLVDLYTEFKIPRGGSYELRPRGFVLAHTIEVIKVPGSMVAHVQGKSSLARLGLTIESAGFIDTGYHGSITLEIFNLSPVPIILRPGLTIAQFTFQFLDSPSERMYGDAIVGSHYQSSPAVVGSRYGLDVNNEIVPTVPCEERRENRPCKWCGDPIQPCQSYDPAGPYHIGCSALHLQRASA